MELPWASPPLAEIKQSFLKINFLIKIPFSLGRVVSSRDTETREVKHGPVTNQGTLIAGAF